MLYEFYSLTHFTLVYHITFSYSNREKLIYSPSCTTGVDTNILKHILCRGLHAWQYKSSKLCWKLSIWVIYHFSHSLRQWTITIFMSTGWDIERRFILLLYLRPLFRRFILMKVRQKISQAFVSVIVQHNDMNKYELTTLV